MCALPGPTIRGLVGQLMVTEAKVALLGGGLREGEKAASDQRARPRSQRWRFLNSPTRAAGLVTISPEPQGSYAEKLMVNAAAPAVSSVCVSGACRSRI